MNPFNRFCTLCIAVVILSPHISIAKGRWKDGFVVNNAGDTLRGKLLFIEKNRSPRWVIFKGKDSVRHTYRPLEIKAFGVRSLLQDLYFTSYVADIDVSSTDLQNANFSSEPHMVPYTFFARLLVSGPKSMYDYKDTIVSKRHFLIEQDGKLTDLIYKRYYTDPTNITYNEAYKNQLTNIYSACPAINPKTTTLIPFEQGALMDVVKAYDKCVNITDPYLFKQEKTDAIVSVVIGGDMTYAHVKGIAYKPSHAAELGISLTLISPYTEKKWSFYNEILLTHYDVNSGVINNFQDPVNSEISATYAKLFSAIRYQYPYYAVKPFMSAGIVNGYALSISSDVTDLKGYTYKEAAVLMDVRKYEQAVFLGIGAKYKEFEGELRLEHSSGSLVEAYTRMHYYHLLFKYAFKKGKQKHRNPRIYDWD